MSVLKPKNNAAYFLIGYHLLLLVGLPWYFMHYQVKISMFLFSFVLLYLSGISITAGYHRLFSHKAYRAHPLIESVILFFGAAAAQGSALRWSYDHRNHHAFVDTDRDPYTITKGFWYAHCLWLLEAPSEINPKVVPDLMKNKLVMFQHRYYGLCFVASTAMICAFTGWLLNDWVGAFFIAIWLRLFFLHHCTWFINSLAHTWGDKPFCQEQTAVNNFILAFLTFGEGYHNYHHTYANDYRNGIRWFHFDPTKWVIWSLAKFGLATGLKTVDPYTIEKRMVTERKTLLLKQIKNLWYVKKDELETKVEEVSERIVERIAEYRALSEKYRQTKREKGERDLLDTLSLELKNLRQRIKSDWKVWRELSFSIMRLRPLNA